MSGLMQLRRSPVIPTPQHTAPSRPQQTSPSPLQHWPTAPGQWTLQKSSLFSQSCSQSMRPFVQERPFSSKLATQCTGVITGLAPHDTAVRNALPMQTRPPALLGSNWQPSLQRSQESKIACATTVGPAGAGDAPGHEALCNAFLAFASARATARFVLSFGAGAQSANTRESTLPAVRDTVTARPSIVPASCPPSAVASSTWRTPLKPTPR